MKSCGWGGVREEEKKGMERRRAWREEEKKRMGGLGIRGEKNSRNNQVISS